jgi:glycosyltransferase involved in cell wall biosynthesis
MGLRRHLRQTRPYDVIHSHVHHYSGVVLRAAWQAGVPRRIAHSHSDTRLKEQGRGSLRQGYLGLMKQWIGTYATDLLASSDECRAALSENAQSTSMRRVLHCGHDFTPFQVRPDQRAVRAELGLPSDAVVVGHVGRFDSQKNQAFLIEMAAELVRLDPAARLLLIGDGKIRKQMEARAAALKLDGIVTFAGIRPDVPRLLMGAMDVFVFPSIHEGLPLACTEAQAAGLPLVISDTMTHELDVITESIRRLSLSDSPARWAEECLEAATAPRPDPAAALSRMQSSDFEISSCLSQLEVVYRTSAGGGGEVRIGDSAIPVPQNANS